MSTHLCLTVRFIQPYFHGRTDGGEPEWPPSPLRVFQALIAASANRWREAQFRDYAAPALEWLEKMPTPSVVATEGQPAETKYRLYVPDNVADKVASSWCGGREASIADYRTEKDVRPMRLKGEAVHYLYLLPEGDAEFAKHRETLSAAARSITHLGWGIDMVAAHTSVITKEELANLTGERWQPVNDRSAPGYRVPTQGTLNDLIQKHQAFLNRIGPDGFKPVPPLAAFQVVGYRRESEPVSRPFVAYRLFHPSDDRMAYFAATRAVSVAGMIRHATAVAARTSGWDEASINQYILGHRENPEEILPRFSYLPLPSIEPPPRNVVGGIRRVLIAEPLESQRQHIDWLRQIMPGQVVTNDEGNEVAILEHIAKDGVVPRFVDRAITWSTVTPVALPGSDEGKANKTDKLLEKMFRHAGYAINSVADLEFRRVSFLRGPEDAKRYRPSQPHYLANCTMYHMRVRWKHPMPGPIALGSGRFCGLGLFAAVP
jgi:CRISPR-associated protein Csb2